MFRVYAYAAYKRVVLKGPEYATLKDSLYYLLDESRNIEVAQNFVSPGVMSEEYIKRQALKELIVDYGYFGRDLLLSYKATVPQGDEFNKELDKMIGIVDAWILDDKGHDDGLDSGP